MSIGFLEAIFILQINSINCYIWGEVFNPSLSLFCSIHTFLPLIFLHWFTSILSGLPFLPCTCQTCWSVQKANFNYSKYEGNICLKLYQKDNRDFSICTFTSGLLRTRSFLKQGWRGKLTVVRCLFDFTFNARSVKSCICLRSLRSNIKLGAWDCTR